MAGRKGLPRLDPALIPAHPDLSFENDLWQAGFEWVVGVDEAGRGALAGPVAAGAVALPCRPGLEESLEGVRDSKQMTPRQRSAWAGKIRSVARTQAVGFASAAEIDAYGILPATRLAVQRALDQLGLPDLAAACLLLDCLFLPDNAQPQVSLIKGDQRSLSIAAASVLAKTSRDALLQELALQFPGYDLAVHKGYGTLRHRQAIQRLGHSPIHRRSFTLTGGLLPSGG